MRIDLIRILGGIFLSFLFAALPFGGMAKDEDGNLFYALDTKRGLLDNNVLQMIQLPDGRMAFMTSKGINVHGDRTFKTLLLDTTAYSSIPGYKGHVHLYVDNDNLLWIKDREKIYCTHLGKLRWIKDPLKGFGNNVTDFFVDSQGNKWLVRDKKIVNGDGNDIFGVADSLGELQDIDANAKTLYAFYSSGSVMVFDRTSNKSPSVFRSYPKSQGTQYDQTSLVVKSDDGQFYQIRTGKGGSIFLHFNPSTHEYKSLFSCKYTLHTINMASAHQVLISSEKGYLMFDLNISIKPREVTELSLPDGTSLVTGINTVYRDQDGGIWFGTYHNGIIYVSPYLGLFFKAEKPWWKQAWAVMLILGIIVLLIIAFAYFYHRKNAVYKHATALADEIAAESVKTLIDENIDSDHTQTDEPEFLQKARKLIEQHISDSNYGVEQLAGDLCMERTGLYKKITALTNETPVNFIKNIRLDKAAELLRQGNIPVSEIAGQTGFSSPGYFTKCFKLRFGIKPSEYR